MNQRAYTMVYGCQIWNVHPLGAIFDPGMRGMGHVF